MQRILVINPNSNKTVTAGLREALGEFASQAHIDCRTLEDGPFGIESDADIEAVIPLIRQYIGSSPQYDAYVIACYSDPGLHECRAAFPKPVFGLQESAVRMAVRAAGRFGVLALSDASIRRHVPYIRKLGFGDRLAGEIPLDITVDEAANAPSTLDRVLAGAARLIEEFGVSAVILGCAGMAGVRHAAQKKLPVPVIEPAQAAVRLAIESNDSRA